MTRPSPSRSGRRWFYLALTFGLALSVFLVFALTRSREASPQVALSAHQPAPAASVASAQQIPPLATPRTPARQPRLVFHPTLTDGAPDGVNEKLSPDSGEVAGEGEREDSETIRQRDDWFFHQRAYPLGFIPSDARLKALNRLDEMIELRNLRDPLSNLRDPRSANPENLETFFPGPTVWTLIGPQPVAPLPGADNFGFPTASGRVVALAVDPTNQDIVYAGAAAGGVWRTTNAGVTWTPLTDQQPSLATGSNSLALDPSSCAPGPCTILYVGTGEGNFNGDAVYGAGVLKITNPTAATPTIVQLGAATFAGPTGPGKLDGGFFFTGLAVHPSNPNILLAAVRNRNSTADSGIYRSINAGVSWSLVATASGAAGTAIVFNPADGLIVYAALGATGGDTDNGVYKSTDAGVTFAKLTGAGVNLLPTANLGRIELALAPSAPGTLYVSFASASTGSASLLTPNGTFKTTDAGLNWSPLTATPLYCNPQCFYDFELRVHPTDASHVWAGGGAFTNNSSTLFRTLDGGASWVDVTDAGLDGERVHVDTHAFAFNTSGSRLYIGNDGGIWKTDTTTAAAGSIDYDGLNATLAITQFYPGHTPHPSDENVHFGGTQDNGTEKYTGSLLWQHVTCGDGAWTAVDPTFPATTYSNCQNIDIRRSFTNGTPGSFSLARTGINLADRVQFIPPLVHTPFMTGTLYFGTCRVWQTTNSASNWTAISPDLSTRGSGTACPSPSGNTITAIAVARSDSNYVYVVTTDGKVQRSTNAGSGAAATWTDLTTLDLPGRFATMVAVDPTDKETAYVTYSGFSGPGLPFLDTKGHVFKRKVDTPGSFWTDISGTGAGALPNIPVNDIVIDRFCAGDCTITPDVLIALYIATDVGVFQSTDDGLNWSPLGTGLPKVQVTSLKLRDESRNLTAATHGRSAWKMQLDNLPPPFRFPLPPDFLLLTSISPATAFGGGAAFPMTLDGANFTTSTAVRWEGTSTGISITSQTPNRIVATIPASRIAAGGLAHVTVFDPGATNDQGTGLLFTIINPAPGFTNFAPGGGPAGVSTTLLALGSNFIPGVTEVIFRDINLIDRPLATTVTSSTELSAALPGNLIPVPGNYTWRIRNASPGGGTSSTFANFVATPATGIDLVMDKSHTGNFTAGTPASYSLRVGNAGSTPSDSTPISVTDTLPAGLTFSSAPPINSWTCVFATGTLTCTNPGPIAAGASSTFTLNVDVDAGAPSSVTNTATVSGGGDANAANNTDNDPTTITGAAAAADLALTKSDSPDPVTVGNTLTYTLNLTNLGPATANNVVVTDLLPANVALITATGTGWTCNPSIPNSVTCTRASLPPGSAPAITITVTPQAAAAGTTITNTANATANETDPNPANNTNITATTQVNAPTTPDMTIAKTHVGNFTVGVNGTYTITASNSGNAPTSGTVTVTDTVPIELVALSLTGTGWNCTLATRTCDRADALAASASYPAITLVVSVSAAAFPGVTNSATVSGGGETNTTNNTANDPTTVTRVDLTIDKSHVGNFIVGVTGTYSIAVSNTGNAASSGTATVTDTIPVELVALTLTGTGWSCTLATLTCTRADALAPSASYPVITLTVNPTAAGSVTNTVTVSGGNDAVPGNNSDSDPTTVTAAPTPDVTITKTHVGNFTVGVNGTYTITASNSGNAPTTGTVTVTDTIPIELVALSLTGTGWTCDLGTRTCTRTDALAAGASYPAITLVAGVTAAAFPSVTNIANVSGGGESNTANNTASDLTTVTRVDLTIDKSHTGNFTVGVNGSYTITVSNTGNAASSGTVTVTDTIPVELVALSLTGTGWTCDVGTRTCTRSDALAPSASYPAITLTVNPTAAGSVTNTVTVSGGNDAVAGNNSDSDPTTIVATADLVVTKTDSSDPVSVGQQFTYTVTITNNGPSPATGVSLSDSLTGPAATFGTITPSQGNCNAPAGGTFTCALGTINASANATVTIQVTPNAVGTLTNTVSATTTATDPNGANNTNIQQTTLVNAAPTPDLAITKTHTGNFTVGVNGSYTITVTNSGNAPTTGTVTMTDTIPTELVALSLTGTGWNCTLAPLSCDRADALAASASFPAITLTVNPITPGQVTNTVTVSGGGETNVANNTANDPTTIIGVADLAVTKSDAPDPVNVGQNLSYTIVVTNNGPNTASGVSLSDPLPANVSFVSANSTVGGCAQVAGTVTCTIGTLANGASATVTIVVTPLVAAANSTLTNTATVAAGAGTTDPDPANNSSTATTTVNPAADLSALKTDSPDPVAVGSNLTYTVTVTNNGPNSAAGVSLTDPLPANVTFVSANSTVGACAEAGGTVTCNIGALANGASATITIVVTPQAAAVGLISNTASVSATTFDHVAGNNSGSASTTVQPSADLSVTKTDSPDPINVGANLTYTVTVTNSGPNDSTGVSLTDPLPGNVSFVSANSTVGGCAQVAGTVTCTIGTLANGASATITIVVTPLVAAANSTLTNTASVSATGTSDPVAGNNFATAITTVNPAADLAVTKTDSPDPVGVGTNLTYTATVANQGPNPAAGVTLTDTLPAGVNFVSANSTVGSCTQLAGTVTCTIGGLNNGATAIITIVVTPTAAATLTNTATGVTTTFDPVAANNSATTSTTARLVTDLSVTKTDSPDPVQAGQNLTYTVAITNNGPNDASGVTLTDPLPANVTFVSANSTVGTCTQAAGTVTCNIGALSNGASATVTIVITTTGATAASITNTASVTGAEFDPSAANNSASATTAVTPVADVQITKTAAPNPVNAGQNLTYTVTVRNNGPSTATGVTVIDTPPATLALVSATGSQGTCSIAAGTITCAVGTLASGAQATATIVVTPQAGAVPSVSNTATVTATQTDPTPANNSSTVVVTVNPAANLTISKTDAPDPVIVSATLTYTVTVVNNGPNTATGVSLTDTLPAGVVFTSATSTVGSCTQAAGTVTCAIGTLANVATATITIVVTAPANTGNITNTATVTATEFDPSTPNTANQTTTVNPAQQPDFAMSATPAALSVPAGLDAIYTISIAQLGGLTGQVALTCSGNPELSTCTIAPASVGLGAQPATATATISTRATGTVPPVVPQPPLGTLRVVLAMLFGMLALAMLAGMARAARQRTWRGALVRLAALVVWSTLAWGCVSSSTGTPPGTYTITITGQQGNITHSTQVTLVVR